MSTACHPQHFGAWLAWYESTTPDTPCIAICSTSQGDDVCKGCGRTFEEVQHWLSISPVQAAPLAAHHAGSGRVALQPLCGTGHRQPAAPHGNSGRQGVVGLGEVIHAAAQILNPLNEFTHGWPLHGRAVLGHDHVDGQIAHHVGPQPEHLGRHHVAAVEALHLGNVPRQRRDQDSGIAGLDHRHAQVAKTGCG